ncbi:putative lumazine-binding protein [Sphingomonas sp. F9_3S_D5_B_2]
MITSVISLFLALAAQTTSGRLPRAGPIPAPEAQEQAVLQPINALFAGIAAHDGAAITALLIPNGGASIVTEGPNGSRTVQRRTWSELVERVSTSHDSMEERLIDPAIESDGSVAMVWGSFVFLVNGKLDHCGTDHFNLVRDSSGWKIADASWSVRTTECPAQ